MKRYIPLILLSACSSTARVPKEAPPPDRASAGLYTVEASLTGPVNDSIQLCPGAPSLGADATAFQLDIDAKGDPAVTSAGEDDPTRSQWRVIDGRYFAEATWVFPYDDSTLVFDVALIDTGSSAEGSGLIYVLDTTGFPLCGEAYSLSGRFEMNPTKG